jgi:hypothetical protein
MDFIERGLLILEFLTQKISDPRIKSEVAKAYAEISIGLEKMRKESR